MREPITTNGMYNANDAAQALLRAMRSAAEPPTMLLTARDAAKALAISEKTLWVLTTPRGSIPAIRVGERSIRYSVLALQQWIEEQQQTAVADANGKPITEQLGSGAAVPFDEDHNK